MQPLTSHHRRLTPLSWGLVLLCLILGSGCASNFHRRMTLRSDPPGALVLLEGNEVGYTPVSIDFDYYGTREITLVKDGYETLPVMLKVASPWYQKVPLDVVSDNLLPVKVTDRQEYTFTLTRAEIQSNEQLLQRAKGLRSEAQMLEARPARD